MNLFDLILVGFLLYNAIIGFSRGFTRIVLELISFFLSIFLAYTYSPSIGFFLSKWITGIQNGGHILSFLLIWGISLLCFLSTSRILGSWINSSFLGIFDRGLGTVFGILRGCVILLPIAWVIQLLHIPLPAQSKLVPIFYKIGTWVSVLLTHNPAR